MRAQSHPLDNNTGTHATAAFSANRRGPRRRQPAFFLPAANALAYIPFAPRMALAAPEAEEPGILGLALTYLDILLKNPLYQGIAGGAVLLVLIGIVYSIKKSQQRAKQLQELKESLEMEEDEAEAIPLQASKAAAAEAKRDEDNIMDDADEEEWKPLIPLGSAADDEFGQKPLDLNQLKTAAGDDLDEIPLQTAAGDDTRADGKPEKAPFFDEDDEDNVIVFSRFEEKPAGEASVIELTESAFPDWETEETPEPRGKTGPATAKKAAAIPLAIETPRHTGESDNDILARLENEFKTLDEEFRAPGPDAGPKPPAAAPLPRQSSPLRVETQGIQIAASSLSQDDPFRAALEETPPAKRPAAPMTETPAAKLPAPPPDSTEDIELDPDILALQAEMEKAIQEISGQIEYTGDQNLLDPARLAGKAKETPPPAASAPVKPAARTPAAPQPAPPVTAKVSAPPAAAAAKNAPAEDLTQDVEDVTNFLMNLEQRERPVFTEKPPEKTAAAEKRKPIDSAKAAIYINKLVNFQKSLEGKATPAADTGKAKPVAIAAMAEAARAGAAPAAKAALSAAPVRAHSFDLLESFVILASQKKPPSTSINPQR